MQNLTLSLRSMCAHLLLRCGAWPKDVVFEPRYQMEDAIEHFFSSVKCIKKDIKGSLTIANSIGSAHLLHSRQRRRLQEARVYDGMLIQTLHLSRFMNIQSFQTKNMQKQLLIGVISIKAT